MSDLKLNTILRNNKYYRKRIQFIMDQLGSLDGSILDLGCGEMLLRQHLQDKGNLNYLGIDNLDFGIHKDFLNLEVIEFLANSTSRFDYIFALGLLDHLQQNQQLDLLKMSRLRCNKCIILSKANPRNFVLRLINQNFFELPTQNLIEALYLIKIPFTQLLFRITASPFWRKILATEIIYIYKM